MKKSQPQSMQFERGSSHPRFFLLTVAAATLATTSAGIVKGDVLYDRTDMTDNQTWNETRQSTISLWQGGFDRQQADDFELFESFIITSVTADMQDGNAPPAHIPADGFLVEFFFNETENCPGGGLPPCPGEIPFAAAFSSSFTAEPLPDTGESFHRYTIDISDAAITLDPGIWWISVVAIDESGKPSSLERFRIIITIDLPTGMPLHRRAGGEDHGNGYPGGVFPDWRPVSCGGCDPTPADAAIKIEGTLVGGEPCSADLDGDGTVGTSDLLELFAAWGPNPGNPADLNGDGTVGTSDLLELFANWGPCS